MLGGIILLTDLIFVTNITNIISGEKIVMWRNFSFPCMTIVGKLKISPHVEKFQMSPHDRCGEIWNSPHLACVWCRKRRHICHNLCNFCHNLGAFMWRKIEPKSTFVEKKWQISGLDEHECPSSIHPLQSCARGCRPAHGAYDQAPQSQCWQNKPLPPCFFRSSIYIP